MKQNLTQQDIKKIFEIVENKNNLYNQKYENLTKFLWSKNIHGMDRIKIIKRFLGEK